MAGYSQSLLVQSIILPIVLTVIIAGVAFLATTGARAERIAGVSLGAGFLLAYVSMFDWPAWPPQDAIQQVAYLAFAGTVLGAVLDIADIPRPARRVAFIVWPVVIVTWLGWERLLAGDTITVLVLVALWAAGAVIFDRLFADDGPDATAATMLLAGAVGVGLVALISMAGPFARLTGALAAATAGFLLWNWPRPRFRFAHAAVFGGGGALLALATTTVLLTPASPIALVIVVAAFGARTLADRLPGREQPAAAPLVVGMVAALPVLVAVAVAVLQNR